MDFLLISLVLLVLAILVAVILVFVKLKKRKAGEVVEPNYQAFFAMGISFLGLGIALTATINPGFLGFIALGIIYMAIGLANRDKWTKSKKEA
jgi:4-amino-4-deoxy-L-arabinose transferase-like glycosyltransferase